MKTERYAHAKKLFLDLCDLPPGEREAMLAQECGDDGEMRAEVESLLRHHDDPPSDPASESPTITVSSPLREEEMELRSVGPYRVVREVGRGGMGVVYLAVREDDQFKRRVAIKLLKRGMDTEEVLKRFKLEEQLLAAMNHPGIARLYNAGETEGGIPYFVMEYVEGLPIDDYCDTNRLHLDERLQLFRKVCAAVHYAHQNLVVHRDLKPSNIIVTAEGEPKLLDFGIAKVIHPEFSMFAGDPTAPELRIMTPEYASPEQVRGLPITTASDVYSLGVILYEMVSGHRPYHLKSRVRDEMERVICDEEPDRPSTVLSRIDEPTPGTRNTATITPQSVAKSQEAKPERLRRNLAGDIDNIVLMAMRKEPQRRYRSAEQLSEDIVRHLEGLPVIARPDTLTYRVSKFVGRNRGGVAAAAAISVLLVGGIVGTGTSMNIAWEEQGKTELARQEEQKQREAAEEQQEIAEAQRERADRHVSEIMALSDTMMHEFHGAIEQLSGALPAREMLLTTAHEFLDGLAEELEGDQHYQLQVATSFDLLGDVYAGSRNPSTGDYEKAVENYDRSRSIRTKLAAAAGDDREIKKAIAASHENFGDLYRDHGDVGGALTEYEAQLRIAEAMAGEAPQDQAARRFVAIALSNVGAAHIRNGDTAAGREHYERSLAIREQLVAEMPKLAGGSDVDPKIPRAHRSLAVMTLRVARQRQLAGEIDGALELYEKAIAIRKRILENRPASLRYRRDLAVTTGFLAQALNDVGRPEDALIHANVFLEMIVQASAENPEDARLKRDLCHAHQIVGSAHIQLDDLERARDHFDSFRKTTEPLAEADPTNVEYQQLLAASHTMIARVDEAAEDLPAAEAGLRRAKAILEKVASADENNEFLQRDLASNETKLGALLMESGRNGDALLILETARDRYAKLVEKDPENFQASSGLAEVLYEQSRLRFKLKETPEAIELAEEALRLLDAGVDDEELREMIEKDLRRYRDE